MSPLRRIDFLDHLLRVGLLGVAWPTLKEHHLPDLRSLRMPQAFLPLHARHTMHLRPTELHIAGAFDGHVVAVLMQRLAGWANTGPTLFVVQEVSWAIDAVLALPLLFVVPLFIPIPRGEARIALSEFVVGNIGIDLLRKQLLNVVTGMKAAVGCECYFGEDVILPQCDEVLSCGYHHRDQ